MSEKTNSINSFDALPIVLTEEQVAELLQIAVDDVSFFIQESKIKTMSLLLTQDSQMKLNGFVLKVVS